MERRALLICSVVAFLGLLAVVLGFAAEATRIKVSQVQFTSPSICTYPRSPALALGLTAAVTLVICQLIINFTSGCICCKRGPHPSSNWTLALVCFVVSWFTFVLAFLLLLTGAALNDQHGEESIYFGSYYCYVVKPGVFAGGALLSLISVTLGILYYFIISSEKRSPDHRSNHVNPSQGGIAMGRPQITPQSSQEPVFVHEDTYMRRQFT